MSPVKIPSVKKEELQYCVCYLITVFGKRPDCHNLTSTTKCYSDKRKYHSISYSGICSRQIAGRSNLKFALVDMRKTNLIRVRPPSMHRLKYSMLGVQMFLIYNLLEPWRTERWFTEATCLIIAFLLSVQDELLV